MNFFRSFFCKPCLIGLSDMQEKQKKVINKKQIFFMMMTLYFIKE